MSPHMHATLRASVLRRFKRANMFYDAVRVKQNSGSWLLVTCVNSRCDNPAAGKGSCLSPCSPRVELAPTIKSLLKMCLRATKWLPNCASAPSRSHT